MLSRRLITVFVLMAGAAGYLFLLEDNRYFALPLGIAIGLGIIVYIFQHQLNWWWYVRFPPRLPAKISEMYRKVSPFYQALSPGQKATFDQRVVLFVEAKEFIGMHKESIAEDVKYMVAYYAVLLTFHMKHYLFKGYDRIIFYLHPFLSPDHPNDVHVCEVEHRDGTIILSIEQLTASFLSRVAYYQTGLHTLAIAYIARYYTGKLPDWGENIWQTLTDIGNKTKAEIEEFIGLKQDDPWPVAVHHYFTYPEKMRSVAPTLYGQLQAIFG